MDAIDPLRGRIHHDARSGSRHAHSGISGALREGNRGRARRLLPRAGTGHALKRPGGASAKTIALIVTLMSASSVSAQIVPNDHWRTIETRHFRIHFTPPLEAMARGARPRGDAAREMPTRELAAPRRKT